MPAIKFTLRGNRKPLSVADHQKRARKAVPDMVWAYIDGGADDLVTLKDNRDAFSRWKLRPRVFTGNEGTDFGVSLGGEDLDLPIFLSPTGMTGLAHHAGELAAARAAEAMGTRAIISTAASYTPEEISEGTTKNHFFQLYAAANPATGARALSQSFIDRAHNAGFAAMFITADVPTHGNREGEQRFGMGVPPRLSPARIINAGLKPRWWINFLRHQRISARMLVGAGGARAAVDAVDVQYRLMRPELNWDDFAWMREAWQRPLYIKGILDPEDAERAVQLGADGILVSNHGGRQLDGVQAALDALPAIVDRVGDRVPVYLDGGIRRGTDVIKALCLGASAVGIARPYIYGLAHDGQRGVEDVLRILRAEVARGLTLMGVASVKDLGREHLLRVDEVALREGI